MACFASLCFPGAALHAFERAALLIGKPWRASFPHCYLDNGVVPFSSSRWEICKLDLSGEGMQGYAYISPGAGVRVGDEEKPEISV